MQDKNQLSSSGTFKDEDEEDDDDLFVPSRRERNQPCHVFLLRALVSAKTAGRSARHGE